MALDDQKMLAMFEAMKNSLQQLVRSGVGGGGASGGGSSRSGSAAIDEAESDKFEKVYRQTRKTFSGINSSYKKLGEAVDDLTSMTEDQLALPEGGRAMKKLIKSLEESSEHLDAAAIEYNKLGKLSIPEQIAAFSNLVKSSDGLETALTKSTRNASLFAASMIKNHNEIDEGTIEYASYIKNMSDAVEHMDKQMLAAAGLIDETTGKFRDNLNATDFADFRIKLGEATVAISEGVNNLGFGSLDDLVGSDSALNAALDDAAGGGEALRSALVKAAIQLEQQGFDLGLNLMKADGQGGKQLDESAVGTLVSKAGDTGEMADLAKRISVAGKATDTAILGLNNQATITGSTLGHLRQRFSTLTGISEEVTKKLGQLATSATIAANFSKAWDNAKKVFEQIQDFNIANVPASFLDVQKASVKMGMSIEETVKFMQENKRTMAIYGDGFDTLTGGMKDTFQRFGYSMKQAGEMVGPSIESAISSGVNVRDGNALNKFIDQSMNSFKDISGIVNMTGAEYMKLNAELLNSEDIQGTMIGMDQQRAQAFAQEAIARRNNLVQLGMSTDQANQLMKTQQAMGREKVTDRIRNAAKSAVMAGQAGLSGEAQQRFRQLSMKGNTSAAEKDELTKLQAQVAKGLEEKRVASYDSSEAAGYSHDIITDVMMPSGPQGDALKQVQQLNVAKRAGIDQTPEASRAAGEAAMGKEAVAAAGNAVNSLTSLVQNPLTQALMGVVGGLAGLMLQLTLTTASMGALGGGVDLPDGGKGGKGGKGILGKLGAGLKSGGAGLLAKAGPAAAVAGAGALGYQIGDKAINPALDWVSSKITGEDTTLGSALYGGVDKISSLWGGDDASTLAASESAAKLDLGKKKLAEGKGVSADMAKTLAAAGVEVPPGKIIAPGQPAMMNPPSISGLANSDSANQVNTNTGGSQTALTVEDLAAKEKLAMIADGILQAVEYLRKISEAENPGSDKTVASSKQIPTAYQYQTGRA